METKELLLENELLFIVGGEGSGTTAIEDFAIKEEGTTAIEDMATKEREDLEDLTK